MHDWTSMVVVSGLRAWQESGDLPTHVPGIEGGGAPVEGPGTGAPGAQPGGTPAAPSFFSPMVLIVLLMIVFMIFTSMTSSRREKKRMAAMLSGLKRGDRVQTLAGMIGTVHEVKEDSIVLRVDETTGAKIHFAKNAVQHVIKPARADDRAEESAATE